MRRALLGAVGILVLIYLGGALISVRSGLSQDFLGGLGSDARLAAPIPMIILQVLAAGLAVAANRRLAVGASVVLVLACGVAVTAGVFDGAYSDARLTAFTRAYQVVMVLWIACVGILAGYNAIALTRHNRRQERHAGR
ncbi:hypothetical protein Q3V23_00370 [Streptomyces sp. VNUA116]|uniref:hypothetical protein n=1 Tax=Streptomyces sp. VNUA116 TaxID=3062449 RepID=UPI00267692C4|nr:hypothetical protein [Streptomyces sp. VNUA116]WKU42652.1 hypothetical protein Q3V23_00370 [Streptomyces sp. VNUA116]